MAMLNEGDEIVSDELLRKLDENGSTGLDMSPGDPVAKEAAETIRKLERENSELRCVKPKMSREDVTAQAVAEMLKKGRDGAYLEVNLDSPPSIRDLEASRMIVFSGYRIEISDPKDVMSFKVAVDDSVISGETKGMDDSQLWLYVFRKVFSRGLDSYGKKS
jgi:hypothetical protein